LTDLNFPQYLVRNQLREAGFPKRKKLVLKIVSTVAVRNAVAVSAFIALALGAGHPRKAIWQLADIFSARDWRTQAVGELASTADELQAASGEPMADALADQYFNTPIGPTAAIPWSFLSASPGFNVLNGSFGLATGWALARPEKAIGELRRAVEALHASGDKPQWETPEEWFVWADALHDEWMTAMKLAPPDIPEGLAADPTVLIRLGES